MLKDSITHDYKSDKKGNTTTEVVDTSNPQAMKDALKDLGL